MLAGLSEARGGRWNQPYYGGDQWGSSPYQQQYYHKQNKHHNPWSQWQQPEKPEGWWSHDQQYSPARIAYKPSAARVPIYGICEVAGAMYNDEDGLIQFAQMPGGAITVKFDLNNLDTETEYRVQVNQKGRLGMDCMATGGEFWPMEEKDPYTGEANPYQDPSRGRISNITSDEHGDYEGMEQHVLLNMAGVEAIIGRSVSLFVGEEEDARACCVIGQDHSPQEMAAMEAEQAEVDEPEVDEPEVDEPEVHPHPHQYGYNPYGYYGHKPHKNQYQQWGPSYQQPQQPSYGGWNW